MASSPSRIALVTGANRGIGYETARQLAAKGYRVILTARDPAKGKAAVERLQNEGRSIEFHELDVTRAESIQAIRQYFEKEFGRLDVLVNNAGVFLDSKQPGDFDFSSALNAKVDTIRQTMETNVYGPFRLCQACLPLMKKNGYGRVVNVSSGMGQLAEMNGGWPAYRISKTALNAVTRIFADEFKDTGILINSVCPGWVKTDMGGADADRDVAEGADTLVWLATLPSGGPTGGFFRDREPIDW